MFRTDVPKSLSRRSRDIMLMLIVRLVLVLVLNALVFRLLLHLARFPSIHPFHPPESMLSIAHHARTPGRARSRKTPAEHERRPTATAGWAASARVPDRHQYQSERQRPSPGRATPYEPASQPASNGLLRTDIVSDRTPVHRQTGF